MENDKLKQLQEIEAEMLKKVAEVCDKHNITYYLCSGTCLGAVRHKGFIPWDDDIDICMPYKDYKRFIKVAQNDLGAKYYLQNCETDINFHRAYTRIRVNNTTMMKPIHLKVESHQGIWLDVFPFVYVGKGAELKFKKALIQFSNYLQMDNFMMANEEEFTAKFGKFRMAIFKLFYKLPARFRQKWHVSIIDYIGNCKKKDYVTEIWGGITQIYSSSILDGEPQKLPFSDGSYSVFPKYKQFLEEKYGDYMKLPPEEDRKGHGDLIIDFEHDYKTLLEQGVLQKLAEEMLN
ncbi:MAG: phosphorylcholine transferase LicD [Oscillospiraceae bacterium]